MALYDPREFPETVSTYFTLEEFLAWVRTKPAGEGYEFCDAARCALGQFLRETRGYDEGACYETDPVSFDPAFDRGLIEALSVSETFGALAARLEAELAR